MEDILETQGEEVIYILFIIYIKLFLVCFFYFKIEVQCT